MVSHLFFYQLMFLGLLWLCVMLHDAWPNECTGGDQKPSEPLPPPCKRSSDPKPFPGLTRKPLCAACEQAHEPISQPPGCPPPRIVPTRGRPRQVDTSWHFCPYGQKTRNRLDGRVYDPAMAHTSACLLSTPSCILDANGGRNRRRGTDAWIGRPYWH